MEQQEILSRIKTAVQEVIPDAKVYLFGSRARGDWNAESDWDILVLTENSVDRMLKNRLHDIFFAIDLSSDILINHIVVHKEEWYKNAGYYALRLNVEPEKITL